MYDFQDYVEYCKQVGCQECKKWVEHQDQSKSAYF